MYGGERAQRELAEFLRQIYPSTTDEEVRIVRELVDGRAISLGLGIIGTIIGASAVHSSIDTALATILVGGRKRDAVRAQAAAFALIGAIAVIAVISFALSYGAQAAQEALRAAGLGEGARLLVAVGSPALGLAAGFVFFYLIYRYVTRMRVAAETASVAALVSAVLWEVAKVAFGFFTSALGTFSAYGPIAFAAGLLTWVYVTAVIILVGAEVIKVRQTT